MVEDTAQRSRRRLKNAECTHRAAVAVLFNSRLALFTPDLRFEPLALIKQTVPLYSTFFFSLFA